MRNWVANFAIVHHHIEIACGWANKFANFILLYRNTLKIPLSSHAFVRNALSHICLDWWCVYPYSTHFESICVSVFSKHVRFQKVNQVTKIYCGVNFMRSNSSYGYFWWNRKRKTNRETIKWNEVKWKSLVGRFSFGWEKVTHRARF